MADMLRPDGRPFVTDTRTRVPRYVIEDDAEGRPVVLNQFTCEFEVIAETRQVLAVDNCRNRKLRYDNVSGVTGVSWSATKGLWVSRIGVKRRDVYLGCYEVFEEAVAARKAAEKRYGFHPNHGRSE